MITIDEIRRIALKPPTYMGLGIVKLATPGFAYRFYCHELVPQTIDRHHTHKNSFRSIVVKGVLRNIVYDITPVEYETQWEWRQGICSPLCIPEVIHENVLPVETLRFDTSAGNEYQITSNVFHRIELVTDKVITKIAITEKTTDESVYIIDKDKESDGYVDPWAIKKTGMECWEAIEYIINDND